MKGSSEVDTESRCTPTSLGAGKDKRKQGLGKLVVAAVGCCRLHCVLGGEEAEVRDSGEGRDD